LPTGALPIATGGHDVPVLAALLLSFALAAAGRPAVAGLAGAAALAMRQTSILALPFVMALVPGARRGRTVAASLLPALALTLPFLLWDPGAFVEDVVRFPLGLGTGLSSAGMPTLGSLLIEAAPTARTGITIGLVVAIVGVTGALLGIRPPRTAATATARAAVAFATAIALAPAARFGYVVYPLSLLAWALAFSRGDRADRSDPASP
ncbi:MAG TPA: hypothetical protein VFQ40_09170, partial [Actinomycetota bacterium]|nr:hypothetical protein [Actinomycetota bacterium]